MTTAETDAIALLTRVRDSVGEIAAQWAEAKALLERICKWAFYGGWPSRHISELIRRIDAADLTGSYGGVGSAAAREITGLLIQIRDSGVVTGGGDPPIQSLLNAQKLSLPANTPVGTRVQVTDGFVVSGLGLVNGDPNADGFYFESGTVNGKPRYVKPGANTGDDYNTCYWSPDDDGYWVIGSDAWGRATTSSTNNFPWEADFSGYGVTLTHPAVQELTAPSTAQGGVFVSGGTQDGVYKTFDSQTWALLGTDPLVSDFGVNAILQNQGGHAFTIYGPLGQSDDPLYYSNSAVATPDLVPNTSGAGGWKNASDDSPASVTVTSVTQGELDAGFKRGSVTYVVNGTDSGRNRYSDVLGIAANVLWGPDDHQWLDDNAVEINLGNVAFPFQGTPEVSITEDPVAAEENWDNVP